MYTINFYNANNSLGAYCDYDENTGKISVTESRSTASLTQYKEYIIIDGRATYRKKDNQIEDTSSTPHHILDGRELTIVSYLFDKYRESVLTDSRVQKLFDSIDHSL
jgi:hypothetical protein